MEFAAISAILQEQFGEGIVASSTDAIDPWIEVPAALLTPVCVLIRNDSRLAFDYLNCLSGVDYLQAEPIKGVKEVYESRFEVVYHLTSLLHRHRLVLKVRLPRWKDDAVGQLPELASVAAIWRTADWHEREVFDLCGVQFTGHPNLQRILCPDDWVGHPLRKDYEMPLEYQGIRGR